MIPFLSLLFGSFVGLALGLTGGGGTLLAVPLLVYGLSIAPHEAFVISLAAVGAIALIGLVQRVRANQVEFSTGTLFALAGMTGAPLGIRLASKIPESILLLLFAVLMCLIAGNMWRQSLKPLSTQSDRKTSTCQRDENGKLKISSRCAVIILGAGLGTGVFSGMFGVGGGVVIVPALIMFSGMPIQRAVGTSLMVIVFTSLSGVISHFIAGEGISIQTTLLFILGGIVGLTVSNRISRQISASMLQRVFSVCILLVALFVISKTLM